MERVTLIATCPTVAHARGVAQSLQDAVDRGNLLFSHNGSEIQLRVDAEHATYWKEWLGEDSRVQDVEKLS